MHYLPVFNVQLVRDGSYKSEVKQIQCPQDARDILAGYLDGVDREHFVVLLLDVKNRVRGINTVSIGSLNSSLVHPREVFKPAIVANSAAIIVGHNHPSGDVTPSTEDISVTRKLSEAGKLLEIPVLDHIIIGYDGDYRSLQEAGCM